MENLTLTKKSQCFKLTIKEGLERTIRKLCKEFPNNEWSGTVFYNVTGSFEEGNLEIEAVDFYLQDIGASTFTEFKRDATLATYMVAHDLLDCYQGLMH